MKIQDIFDNKISDYFNETKDYIERSCLTVTKYSTERYSVFLNPLQGEEDTFIVRVNDVYPPIYGEIEVKKFEGILQEKVKHLTENNPFEQSELKIKLTALEECLGLIAEYKSPRHCTREHL